MRRAPAKRAIKQERALKTRQEILNSAIQLFARRGMLATTMADLARAIHMTPGALYWHFPTKEDLLLAAIEELHTRFVASFEPILIEARSKGWPASRQLTTFMEHTGQYLHTNREHGIFFGMLGTEAAENNDAVAAALRDALSVYVAAVEQILVYGQMRTKEFRSDVDTRTLAHAIIFGNVGIIAQHNLFRDSLSYIPLVHALNDMVRDGFVAARK